MEKLIFNASLPRSGSVLVQSILNQHPNIYAPNSSPLLGYMYGTKSYFDNRDYQEYNSSDNDAAFLKMCSEMPRTYYKNLTDKAVVVEKNREWPFLYNWVKKWEPNAKMIYVIRDLRSILASYERTYRNHGNYFLSSAQERPPITLNQRIDSWLSTSAISHSLQRVLDLFYRELSDEVLFVRYEDFLKDPQGVADSIYNYIGEEPYQHNLDSLFGESFTMSSQNVYENITFDKGIRSFKENDWNDVLPETFSDLILDQYSWFFKAFKYID